MTNLEIVHSYLRAIEQGAPAATMGQFFGPEAVHQQPPNLLFPNGRRDDLKAMLEASERGKKILVSQTYEIKNAIAAGDQVALEVLWTGTLAIPFG